MSKEVGPAVPKVPTERDAEAARRGDVPAVASRLMLSIREVAERLGVSVPTVWRRVDSGKLRAYRDEGIIRVDESDLDSYIEARKSGGDATTTSHAVRAAVALPVTGSFADDEERGLALARKFVGRKRGAKS